jgi:uncharacterized membrane protein
MSSQVVCFVCNLPILTHQVNNEHKSINQGTFFLHLFLFGLDILNPTNSIQTKENNKKKKKNGHRRSSIDNVVSSSRLTGGTRLARRQRDRRTLA